MGASAAAEGARPGLRDLPSAVAARHALILGWLAAEGRLDVTDLVHRLGVAQQTVRRDLGVLEADGRLQRVHGGAVPLEADPFPIPTPVVALGPDDHALARELWTRLPRTGSLLLGAGPLSLALIAAIAADPPRSPGLTVVSTSLDAAIAAARVSVLSVYNVGGSVAPGTRALEGDWALQELGRLQVDVSVVCPAGISPDRGLGQSTPAAAAVSQAEVACGQNVIAVVRAAVWDRPAFVQFASWQEIDVIMVAGRPRSEAGVTVYRDRGVEVVVVDSETRKVGGS